jgi:hypothetical protein
MKFTLLLEELLNEASPIEIYNKYYSDIKPAAFLNIVSADPQTELNPGRGVDVQTRVKRLGKWSKLLLSLYKKGGLKFEDLDRAKDYLSIIYTRKVAIDINKINELSDLYNEVKKYLVQDKGDLGTIIQSLSEQDYKLLHNGEEWFILQPLTEKGACYLGVNTEWCTAWGPYSTNKSYRDRGNHFSRHNSQGPLYIMINKNDESDKYQFHFETRQYMNPGDQRIDTGELLSENPEIKNFFFPSLTQNITDKKIIDSQLGKISILDSEDSFTLIRNLSSEEAKMNPLINDMIRKNIDGVNEKIKDEELTGEIELQESFIVFPIKSLKNGVIEDVESVISSYEADKENAYDRVYEDLKDRMYGNDEKSETLEPYFEEYYKQNSNKLKSELGVFNYEQFKNNYFEPFYKSEDIIDTYIDKTTSLNYEIFEIDAKASVTEIEKYIQINYSRYSGGYDIYLALSHFFQLLINKNIQSIDNNLLDIIEDYIEVNRIQTDYEYNYNFGNDVPEYNDLKDKIEEFFEKEIDDRDASERCVEVRNKFNDVIRTVFNGNSFFENEHVLVIVKSGVDCETESVDIQFRNKDTGKTYNGMVKVENLASYVTNYQLFEQFIKFKKNIL